MNEARTNTDLTSRRRMARAAELTLSAERSERPGLGRHSPLATRHSRQRGFTLIELLIVISIILILVGIAAGNYQRALLRSKETVLHQDLQEMRKAIDNFTMDKDAAPQALDDLVPQYLRAMPTDPITNAKDWVPQVDSVVINPDQPSTGITDVHSASDKTSPFEQTAYNTW